jgi:hypothetical protein
MAKRLATVARPIVFRPKPGIARLVAPLVVVAQRIQTSLGCAFVEPTAQQDSPHRFDAHHRRTGTVVLDRRVTLEASLAPMVDVPLAADIVRC